MTTLQISDHIASILSSSELIQKLVDKYRKEHELLEDLMDSLPSLPTFKGPPMDIQRTMRDEWS